MKLTGTINDSFVNAVLPPTEESTSLLLAPLVKWAGGKEQELKYILPALPAAYENYFEPFVGGGAVYTAVHAQNYYINDRSAELIGLYRSIVGENREIFFAIVDEIISNWQALTEFSESNREVLVSLFADFIENKPGEKELKVAIQNFIAGNDTIFRGMITGRFPLPYANFEKQLLQNLSRKLRRMKILSAVKALPQKDIPGNIETALKSAYYMYFREVYNLFTTDVNSRAMHSAVFLYIRNFAYSGMFRYNGSGGFNVPYGGMEYNRKNFSKKVAYLRSPGLKERLEQTTISNVDFEEFLRRFPPGSNDFVFLDPPYDTEFNTYAKNEFGRKDQKRLVDFLTNECKAKWMIVIENTPFILDLYRSKGLNISSFDKKYLVSFMNRNNKNAEHLLITNY